MGRVFHGPILPGLMPGAFVWPMTNEMGAPSKWGLYRCGEGDDGAAQLFIDFGDYYRFGGLGD